MQFYLADKKSRPLLGKVFLALADFVFPQVCIGCGKMGRHVCENCLSGFPPARPKCLSCGRKNPFGVYCNKCYREAKPKNVIARYAFVGALRELVHQFKYEDCTILQKPLGQEMSKVVTRIPGYKEYAITYIPLAKKRRLRRGYNQAELLAEAVSRELTLPLKDLLARVDTVESQVEVVDPKERKRNIKDVFNVKDNVEIPQKVILIDDVVTTGATLEEATRVLKEAGAKDVYVVALAMA